jgi:uncharacterized protein (TIGR02646 family)
VKFIRKGPEPVDLRRWKQKSAGLPEGAIYANIEGHLKERPRARMLRGQGYLCAYTMASTASPENCHVEDIQPQSLYPERSADYDNMVLCVPRGAEGPWAFGAVRKGASDVSVATFVSPLNRSCETRVRFTFDGHVMVATGDELTAKLTIARLALNDPSLVRARLDAIRLQEIGPYSRKPISDAEARRFAQIISRPDASGRMRAYCIAVRQAAELFASQREARSIRLSRKPPPA